MKTPSGRTGHSGQRGSNNLAGYLFIGPWLFGFIALTVIPIAASFIFSFTDYDILSPPRWVGLRNFQKMFFQDPRYWKSVKATVYYALTAVPLRLIVALAVAMLLNVKRRGVAFYRALFYAPSVVGEAVHQSLSLASALGHGRKYVPSLVEAQEQLSGAKLVPR